MVSLIILAYFIRLIVMMVTGLSSDFVETTVVTTGIAFLPLIFLVLIGVWKKRRG